MSVFRNVVFLAALAGLVAGLFMTVLQTSFTVPLILQAETFENAEPAHDHGAAPAATAPAATQPAVAAHDHGDGAEAWAPQDGMERTLFTALANVVTGVGFALLLVAASEVAGGITSLRAGLAWGFAGFAAFTLAPGLGLPPELPAMPAAELFARQTWWIGTVAATAAGLAMIAFRRESWLLLLGVALLVVPHVIGAPQPESHESPIPPDLHHRFVVAATVTNLLFWLALGAAVAYLRSRFLSASETTRASFA